MSDFLSGFSEKKDGQKVIKQSHQETKPNVEKAIKKQENKESETLIGVKDLEKENALKSGTKFVEPETTSEESIIQEQTYLRDEPTELDPDFKKKQLRMRVLIGVGIALAIVVVSLSYYFMSSVKLPDFAAKNISEARTWANTNRIELESESIFSNEIDLNVVIEQNVQSGKRIKKGSTLKLTLSKGSDPDEVLGLMDFAGANETSIRQWLEANHIDNLKITKVFDESVANGDFVKIELLDKELSPESFKRKDAGTIFISKGVETFDKTIVVPDFKDKGKGDVETFRTTNKFINPFIYEEAYSDTIDLGTVISQSVSKDEKVGVNDVLTLVISKGKALVVPNYAGTTSGTFATVNAGGIQASALEWYSVSAPYGSFISQSIGAGTNITDQPDASVLVYYSVGKPYISGLVGLKEGDLAKYFFDFNSKGTNLTYVSQYRSSCEPKGTIFEASHNEEHVGMNEKIWVTISLGASGCDTPIE